MRILASQNHARNEVMGSTKKESKKKKKKQRKMFHTENGVDDRDKKLRSSKV